MSCKEASHEKCSENKLQFKLKNIKNDIFKSFKTLNMTPKQTIVRTKNIKNDIFKKFKNSLETPKSPKKNKKFKIFRKSCKEASNKKVKKTNYSQN